MLTRMIPACSHMGALIILVWLLVFAGNCGASENEQRESSGHTLSPSVRALWADEAPRINGRLDEAAWQQAGVILNLTQVEPDELATPTERTEVRILFDKDYLYIGVRCYDSDPKQIRATEMERDSEFESDDFIAIALDTFLDRRNGYQFKTNPLGARTDGLIENNRRVRGDDWDGIWYVKSSIDSEGWAAEIAIPFKTVSFDEKKTTWGFNIERTIRRKNETDRWAGTGIARGVEEVALAGQILGLAGIQQGVGLDIVPGLSATYLRDHDDASNDDQEIDASFDAFYHIFPSLTASLTVNTDFAETEVDEREINFDRFDLFIPEKRDFFLQDAGIFEFGGIERNGRPFFSRRIGLDDDGQEVDIVAGIKIAGRAKNLNIGALAVRQDNSRMRDATNLYVLRPSLNILEESTVGMIVTHGNPIEKEDNTVVGFDFMYRNSAIVEDQEFNADLWWQRSLRENVDDDDMAYGATLDYPNEPIELTLEFREIQQQFRPALGFVNRRGIRQYAGEGRYRWRFGPKSYARFVDTGFSSEVVEKKEGGFIETGEFSWNALRIDNRYGDRVDVGYKRQYEKLDEDFEIRNSIVIPVGSYYGNRFYGKISTAQQRWLSGGIEGEFGDFFDGDRARLKPSIQLRPSRFFLLSTEYEYNHIDLSDGSFNTHLIRSLIRLQFSPDITWSTLAQWDNESDALGVNSIFRWTVEPGRDFFFVVTHSSVDNELTDEYTEPTATEVTGKVLWTFRF